MDWGTLLVYTLGVTKKHLKTLQYLNVEKNNSIYLYVMTYDINESEKQRILGLYEVNPIETYLKERLESCKFTKDGKFVLFEDNIYSCETGDMVPLTERWTWSDTFHTMGDLLSAGMDTVLPGSGAVIDTLNAISYVLEAQRKRDPKERTMLYVMAAVTFAFVVVPGPLQAAIIPLKVFLKTGKGAGKPIVRKGLAIVSKNIGRILKTVPNIISRALKTRLGRTLLGRNSAEGIAHAIKMFSLEADVAVAKVLKTKTDDEIKVMEKALADRKATYAKDLADAGGDHLRARKIGEKRKWRLKGQKIGRDVGKTMATLSKMDRKAMGKFFEEIPLRIRGRYIMKKLGFKAGKKYGYIAKGATEAQQVTVIRGMGNGFLVKFPNGTQTNIPYERWLEGTVGRPWALKGYVQSVPVFVKRMAELILPDGTDINYDAMGQLIDLDPDATAMESLAWLVGDLNADSDVANIGSKPFDKATKAYQEALLMLGYKLPQFGADGDFGPETQKALTQFQNDKYLKGSVGKMNRLTAQQLALALRDINAPNSKNLQNTLNSL